ncbi:uncharacterized protein LOC135692238 [Rhopilema esculentum]|uniref:uncharacterized protein LOC135692238 n=1 Tax=Rhopilema esculentum TaxID=499914 RepID=UPI0031D8AA0C
MGCKCRTIILAVSGVFELTVGGVILFLGFFSAASLSRYIMLAVGCLFFCCGCAALKVMVTMARGEPDNKVLNYGVCSIVAFIPICGLNIADVLSYKSDCTGHGRLDRGMCKIVLGVMIAMNCSAFVLLVSGLYGCYLAWKQKHEESETVHMNMTSPTWQEPKQNMYV